MLLIAKWQVVNQDTDKPTLYTQEGGKQEHMDICSAPEVVLPPDSFLVLRLPFVYHNVEKNGTLAPLSYRENAPEHTPWLVKGTALRVLSRARGGFGVFTFE